MKQGLTSQETEKLVTDVASKTSYPVHVFNLITGYLNSVANRWSHYTGDPNLTDQELPSLPAYKEIINVDLMAARVSSEIHPFCHNKEII